MNKYYHKIIENLKPGMMLLVDSNSMQDKNLPDAIAWAQYKKNYQEIKYNHGGFLYKDETGQWWVSEEKKMFAGVGSTAIEEYLAQPYNLLFRDLNHDLSIEETKRLSYIVSKQSANFRYRTGGLFTELFQYVPYKIASKIQDVREKIFGKRKEIKESDYEINYKEKEGIYICTEWIGVALNYVCGMFQDWKGKSPKDWQTDSRFTDTMIWSGQHQKLIILK